MSDEIKFPMEFPKCPICGCTDTVCRLATQELKEKGRIPKDAPVSLEKGITPLEQPQLVATVTVLVCHYDVCAKCGTRYCTRVDKGTGTAQPMQPMPPDMRPFGFGQKNPRMS